MKHESVGFDRSEAARGDLLALDDREPVARPVGRVEEELAAVADCISGSVAPANDGADFDGDGQCDAGDTDDENDGALDENDSDDNNPKAVSYTQHEAKDK